MATEARKKVALDDLSEAEHASKPVHASRGRGWYSGVQQFVQSHKKLSIVLLIAIIAALATSSVELYQWKMRSQLSPQGLLRQQFTDQLPQLQAQVAKDPNNPALQQQLGVAKYATGDIQGAKDAYEKGVALDSSNAVLHNNLGNTYRDLGDYAKAEAEYRQAMQLNPQLTTPYMNLGSIYQYILGKPDTALTIYASGIKSNPEYVDFYNATAAIYEQQGLKSKALAAYQQALKVQPGNPAATAGVARLK
jgi:tetratricopeptide (TPR) repeat protein